MAGPEKRSVTLSGHRTSITLEPEFWAALKDIASEMGLSIGALVGDIDRQRFAENAEDPQGLSSALRVFVLNHYRKT